MNRVHAITAENLLNTLPVALQPDQNVQALAASAAEVLAARPEEIDRLLIYPAIDRLDEELLDILAYDFKVDWWDAEYSLEGKRQTLKDSWAVHRMLGTKAAIETAIRAIYPLTEVEEWFEYGGNPYCFRISIDTPDRPITLEEAEQVMRGIFLCKNLRSHLDVIQYIIHIPPSILHIGGAIESIIKIGIPEREEVRDFRASLYIGGAVESAARIGIPESPYEPDFTETLRVGGTNGIHSTTGIPEAACESDFTEMLHVGGNTGILAEYSISQETGPPSFSIQRTGNVCTIIMNPSEGS